MEPMNKYKDPTPKIMEGHTSFVGPLAWIPPNSEFPEGGIVSGGMDTLVKVWDLRSGNVWWDGYVSYSYSPFFARVCVLLDNPYDTADKWLLREDLPLSYRQQIVDFILENTGQKTFSFDPTFRDPYTGCK